MSASGLGAAVLVLTGLRGSLLLKGTTVDNTLGFCRKSAKGFAIELGAMI